VDNLRVVININVVIVVDKFMPHCLAEDRQRQRRQRDANPHDLPARVQIRLNLVSRFPARARWRVYPSLSGCFAHGSTIEVCSSWRPAAQKAKEKIHPTGGYGTRENK
jgi:hypothetical protein